ncbi:MAG TPA: hypothetical protein VLA64_02040 [Azonexus sp.]|nr:hypothetical protein [Azonexus sp.]
MQRRTFGAQATAIRGMVRVAANAGYSASLGFNEHAATNATVATSGFHFSFHNFPSVLATATAVPTRKIMGLDEKQGK